MLDWMQRNVEPDSVRRAKTSLVCWALKPCPFGREEGTADIVGGLHYFERTSSLEFIIDTVSTPQQGQFRAPSKSGLSVSSTYIWWHNWTLSSCSIITHPHQSTYTWKSISIHITHESTTHDINGFGRYGWTNTIVKRQRKGTQTTKPLRKWSRGIWTELLWTSTRWLRTKWEWTWARSQCIVVKRFLPLGFPVQTITDM